jgi:hypothetical protein
MAIQCPACGAYCVLERDPDLPPHLARARCLNPVCEEEVVREEVEI